MSTMRKIASDVLPRKYQVKLRNALHPAQRVALGRVFAKPMPDKGLLSVVIPVFNVAEYVAQCLTSVVGQSYTNLQIIIVDDGSTDDSMLIVDKFAKWDKRISVISLKNGGNGRARNIGISAARGEYLTFADSDDVVAPGAYALMMDTITKTRSDFVVGSSVRLIGKKRRRTKLSSHMHERQRLRISIDDFPDILDDVFLWNKTFNKVFWDEKVGSIPEGILYEDQETTARAYIRAQCFDVLEEVVYSWRQRPDGSSITQGKRSQKDLDDRIRVAHHVSSLVVTESSPRVLEKWCIRLLGSDLVPYYEQVPYTLNEYWSALSIGVKSLSSVLLENIDDNELVPKIEPHARVLFSLALAGLKDEFEQVIVDRTESGTGYRVEIEDSKFYAVPNYAGELPVLAGSRKLECEPKLLQLDSQVRVRGRTGKGELALSGHAFVRGLADEFTAVKISALPSSKGTAWTDLNAVRANDEYLDAGTNDPFASHCDSAFQLIVPEELLPTSPDETLSLRISLTVAGNAFSDIHSIAVPRRMPPQRPTNATLQVVGFDAIPESESFYIDVSWGTGPRGHELFLATRQHRNDPVTTTDLGANVFRYVFRLPGVTWGRTVQAPPSGAYTLRYRSQDDTLSTSPGKPVVAEETLQWDLPRNRQLTRANIQAWATSHGSFAVTVAPPLDADERGKYRQKVLQQSFLSGHGKILRHIVFESFGGKSCTDSPRAISDQLHLENPSLPIYWSIVDFSVDYPAYSTPLVRGSREWFSKIQSAKVLVNNNNFPFYFRKDARQYYLQTWHGTPLKKIGIDAPHEYISQSYRELMKRESGYWDCLLTQNNFSEKILPSAFGYHGEVICEGYPRNDALTSAASPARRGIVREQLGLSDSQVAILYAPTWRDDAKSAGVGQEWVGYLDSDYAIKELGDDYSFLIRAHHNVSSRGIVGQHDQIVDVSSYPEINDLMLAADILITDYSSILFDFLITGKPMYFLAPDLKRYTNTTRGLYLDYDRVSEGRLYENTKDILRVLKVPNSGTNDKLFLDLREEFVPFGNMAVSASIASRIVSIIDA